MSLNPFKAIWTSHSSIGSYLKCPRLYYLQNVYKTPQKRKIAITSPFLTLGYCVHEVLEPLAWIAKDERLNVDWKAEFLKIFQKHSGKLGGFKSSSEEDEFRQRGIDMLDNVRNNPTPLLAPACRLEKDRDKLPYIWLAPEENLILCGKTDWLQYLPDESVRVIDFKTGRTKEKSDSLQLHIYNVLIDELTNYNMSVAAYWYIAVDKEPVDKEIQSVSESREKILFAARSLKRAREDQDYNCRSGGCKHCHDYERIIKGEGEHVGLGVYKQELYFLP